MSTALLTVVVALALLLAAVAAAYVVRDRAADGVLLGGLALLELALVVQAVVGIIRLTGTDRDVSGATFVGYLVGAVVLVPVGALWALGERSREGTAAVLLVGLVVPVLELRLHEIWAAPGG